ncbi:MAG: hypothetical protein HUU17_12395 [Chthonomonadales bacterium]|nr:hypothetical protein [Chthonomonadales bacterium]
MMIIASIGVMLAMACPIAGIVQQAPPTQAGSTDAEKAALADKLKTSPWLLPRSLFTPNDRWTYDGSNMYDRTKARFGGALAGQTGTVSIGDNRWLNSGSFVKYQVWRYGSAAEAREYYRQLAPASKPAKNVRRTVRKVAYGDESCDVADAVLDDRGIAQSQTRLAAIRIGAYLISVRSSANMKAFGPAPQSGSRPWLGDDVFTRVLNAAIARARTLLKTPSRGKHGLLSLPVFAPDRLTSLASFVNKREARTILVMHPSTKETRHYA